MESWRSVYLRFRPGFGEAIDARFYTIDYLDALIEEGTALFWWCEDAAILAEVRTYPAGARVLHGLVATGKLDRIKSLIADAEAWARDQGCIASIIESRAGWLRVLRAEGYRLHQQAIIKEL